MATSQPKALMPPPASALHRYSLDGRPAAAASAPPTVARSSTQSAPSWRSSGLVAPGGPPAPAPATTSAVDTVMDESVASRKPPCPLPPRSIAPAAQSSASTAAATRLARWTDSAPPASRATQPLKRTSSATTVVLSDACRQPPSWAVLSVKVTLSRLSMESARPGVPSPATVPKPLLLCARKVQLVRKSSERVASAAVPWPPPRPEVSSLAAKRVS
mmetsp:Transcript_36365/g.91834  ORF Transcript_36365/g.91834 Transcript_36365/m.91834 type:complete len:217 (-) Transcript_36365:38-688(-)